MKRIQSMLHKEYFSKILANMKLIWITLVIAAALQVNGNGYAQNTVTLSECNSPLTKVLKEIKRQTGYSYIFKSHAMLQAEKVNIQVANVSLRDALEMIFNAQPLMYVITGKTIVVKEREEAKKIAYLPIDVRGRIANEKGEPVEGVTVTVKGTKKIHHYKC